MRYFNIYLGAIGWVHDQWMADFYPEDMPEDWRLGFYNTQFRCVYLPYEIWSHASDEEVSIWLQETQQEFRFLLQQPASVDEEVIRLAGRFGERGIFDQQVEMLWMEGKIDLRDLAKRMQEAEQNGTNLFLISRHGEMTQLRQVKELMEVLGV